MNEHDLWLLNRKQGLGGSDIAPVLGISPWKTAVDVFYDKVSIETKEIKGVALRRGKYLEPLVVELYQEQTNNTVWHNTGDKLWAHPIYDFLRVTPDGLITLPAPDPERIGEGIFEAKTAVGKGARHWYDGVPDFYKCQVQHEMFVTGRKWADIAFLVDDEFNYLTLHPDPNYAKIIVPILIDFWENHVMTGIPPKPKTVEDYKKVYAQSIADSRVEASDEILDVLDRYYYYKKLLGIQEEIVSHTKEQFNEADGAIRKYMKDYELLYRLNKDTIEEDILVTYKTASNKSRRLSMKEKVIMNHIEKMWLSPIKTES